MVFVFSLGCGIGYGYLHRIPANPDVSPVKPPTPVPEEMPSPELPTHGYTEVNVAVSVTVNNLYYASELALLHILCIYYVLYIRVRAHLEINSFLTD